MKTLTSFLVFTFLILSLSSCVSEADRKRAYHFNRELTRHVTPSILEMEDYLSLMKRHVNSASTGISSVNKETFEYKVEAITKQIDENLEYISDLEEVDEGIGLKKAGIKALKDMKSLVADIGTYMIENYKEELSSEEYDEQYGQYLKFLAIATSIQSNFIEVQNELASKYGR